MHYTDYIQIYEVEAQNLRLDPKQYACKLSEQAQMESTNFFFCKFIPALQTISEHSSNISKYNRVKYIYSYVNN